jgi:hypothetical protein
LQIISFSGKQSFQSERIWPPEFNR